MMKAIIYNEYGSPDVLHLEETEKPTPKDNEILIRVCATPVNYGDISARNFANIPAREFNMPALLWFPALLAFGLRKPKNPILGSELAGEVEAVGKDVTKFKKGDQVFAYIGMKMGANAEYICIPEDGTVGLKPENMSYQEAAAVPYGGIMALSLLRRTNIQPGQKVIINGASGGIGSVAVQLAKSYGAEVTGVCSTPRVDYVAALGADNVIDYTQEDFTQNGETYDLIFDILGRSSFSRVKGSLTENGIYLLASFKMDKVFQMLRTSISGKKKVICAMASEKQEDMILLKEMVEEGKIKTIIDRTYPLEETAEAHRYIEAGQKKGQVVITIR
jgi:NADPH:quinone reductase-like Zn-dependent oxidoreductase